MSGPEALDPWIEGYLAYLTDVRRQAARTVIDVRCTLKRACAAMARLRPGTPLWKAPLEDYLRWIEEERTQGRAAASIAKQLSHVRGLLTYASRGGRSDRNVLDGFELQDRGQGKAPDVLTEEAARRLVLACPKGNRESRRDRMMILLLYGCGLRTSELCQLSLDDLDAERQEVTVRLGKGRKPRQVPVLDGLWTELMAYVGERRWTRGALFRTTTKRTRVAVTP